MSLWLPNSGWCLSVFSFFRLSHRTRDKKWCDYLCVCHEPSLGPITFYWKALAAFNKWNISAEIFKNMREIGSEKKGRITLFYGLRHILGVHVTLCCRVMTQESLCSLCHITQEISLNLGDCASLLSTLFQNDWNPSQQMTWEVPNFS